VSLKISIAQGSGRRRSPDIWRRVLQVGIASSFNIQLARSNFLKPLLLRELIFDGGRSDDAHAHVEHAKLHAFNDRQTFWIVQWSCRPCFGTENTGLQWRSQRLCALPIFTRSSGLLKYLWRREVLLRWIDEEMDINGVTANKPGFDGNSLQIVQVPTPINSQLLA